MKIAVVGLGFVGTACAHIFRNNEVIKIDPKLGTSVADLFGQEPDVIMVCAPTPMGADGKIDSSIVEDIFDGRHGLRSFPNSLIVLKSTVLPDIVAKYEATMKNFIYNPEFLTERNALWDAEHPTHTVLGGPRHLTAKMEQYYREYSTCEDAPFYHVTAKEASLIKYGINSFLTTKVLFFNQYADLCEKIGADYLSVKFGIGADPRIGLSHMNVPGHDGRKGAASACFAKDIPAIIQYSEKELSILREVWNVNCDIRNSYGELLPRETEQHITFNKI